MLPSESVEALPSNVTVSGAVPLAGFAEAAATGGAFGAPPPGTTKRVTLCAGTVAVNAPPATLTSLSRVIAFAELSCHTCAPEPAGKFARFTVTGVLPERTLLTTMTVRALSLERTAAKLERLSGFGTLAATLVSPKADLLPS